MPPLIQRSSVCVQHLHVISGYCTLKNILQKVTRQPLVFQFLVKSHMVSYRLMKCAVVGKVYKFEDPYAKN